MQLTLLSTIIFILSLYSIHKKKKQEKIIYIKITRCCSKDYHLHNEIYSRNN
jgi:hypothetical protein